MSSLRTQAPQAYCFRVVGRDGKLRAPEIRREPREINWVQGNARYTLTFWSDPEWAALPDPVRDRFRFFEAIPGIGRGFLEIRAAD